MYPITRRLLNLCTSLCPAQHNTVTAINYCFIPSDLRVLFVNTCFLAVCNLM